MYSFTKLALHKRSLYDLVSKQEGFLALQSYFVKATLLLDRDTPQTSYPGYRVTANTNCYSSYCIEVDEFKFFKIAANVVEQFEADWLASMEVYEVLDSSVMESIGFREFCAFVLLVAAVDSA